MAEQVFAHHRLTVDRALGALHLLADLRLYAPWTILFGPSGSGKSSLLRAACGLLEPGGVHLSRREPGGPEVPLLSPQHAHPAHRLGLGYAPQQGALFPHLSVAENVAFAGRARSRRLPVHDVVEEMLELFELVSLRDRSPRLLSGGERQRVNLARAFAVPGVRLLLLDEPFTGLGRTAREVLLQRLVVWTRTNDVPVLSVSHDVDEALLLQADVVVLEEGRIIRRGPAPQALAAERERLLHALGADSFL